MARQPTNSRAIEPRALKPPQTPAKQLASPPLAVPLDEFLGLEFPPRKWIAEGLIQERDAAMVHAFRGVGKTRFVHGLGLAIAAGSQFLRYVCPEPRGVLLVDGELPREQLQEMLASQVAGAASEPIAPFKILSADMLDHGLESLAEYQGQAVVHACLENIDVVILDNISTLCSGSVAENEAESWNAIQHWLLQLRRTGLTVVLVHHEGKTGKQRGTSKREDVLSQVVQLKRPTDYKPEAGCQFEVHLTKARNVFGEAAQPFAAQLATDDGGRALWTWKPLEEPMGSQILALMSQGVTKQRDLAEKLGVGVGTVNRRVQTLRKEGALDGGGS
jgi:putative DNA primase/helicase